jgi:hypothetical protein
MKSLRFEFRYSLIQVRSVVRKACRKATRFTSREIYGVFYALALGEWRQANRFRLMPTTRPPHLT